MSFFALFVASTIPKIKKFETRISKSEIPFHRSGSEEINGGLRCKNKYDVE